MCVKPCHAVVVGAPATLPTASTWLSFLNAATPGALSIVTIGGESVTPAPPSGMYPIRAAAVTNIGAGVTNLVAWWT
jgi:hypothetical protein